MNGSGVHRHGRRERQPSTGGQHTAPPLKRPLNLFLNSSRRTAGCWPWRRPHSRLSPDVMLPLRCCSQLDELLSNWEVSTNEAISAERDNAPTPMPCQRNASGEGGEGETVWMPNKVGLKIRHIKRFLASSDHMRRPGPRQHPGGRHMLLLIRYQHHQMLGLVSY